MQELAIDTRQYGIPEGIADNIRYSMSLGLPEISAMSEPHDGTFVIVGSGPSVQFHAKQIREDQSKTICAVKGAYDYLRERNITPDYYLSVEPRYRPVKNPSRATEFLLASRVNSQLFDELKDFKRVLWHSWSEFDGEPMESKLYIGGGSTSGLRAINVGYVKGFRKFKLYGMDSCLSEEGEKRVGQGPLSKHVNRTDVIVGGRRFICNMAMAAQAQDFQNTYDVMPDVTVEIIGGGLLAAIIEERKKQGLKT